MMKATVVHSPLGIFAFDADDKRVDGILFPKDAETVAGILKTLERGGVVEEVGKLKAKLDEKGCDELVFEDAALAQAFIHKNAKVTIDVEAGKKGRLRALIEEAAIQQGYFENGQNLTTFIHDVSIAMAKKVVQEESGQRDLIIIQAIQALDDLDHTFNLFSNRLREWHGYHFPEMAGIIDESDLYARLVALLGDRSNFTFSNLTKEGLSSERVETLAKAAQESMGADLLKEDLEEIVELARLLLQFHESRARLEKYLDTVMQEVAPNTSTLLGPTVSARLIATAGGLENLAKRSASTIQVLGAEKALFRSLRSGSRPPKHGLIFQHKDVHQAPRWQRGKIARALASKAAIAIRLDAYHGEYRGQQLLREFEERVKEIREKYPQPPSRRAKSGRG